ncbi:hypothetical protein ALP73_101895 [Pseudomonas coronafaciens pv. garcae]|nr:hypothetical protein ALP73_101895 [Pseudomonas coronafaciens pv. garcae]RMV09521.1 hypothetical protein ALP20_102286 [Pseudomonas coronafaciens pv. coronafaciens]
MMTRPTACILAPGNGWAKRRIPGDKRGCPAPDRLPQNLTLYLATHDPIEDHDQYRHADCDVLKGLFGDSTGVLQMRQAKHDRQNAKGDQNRVNQTLFVGHNSFLEAHERAVGAACLRA